MRDIAYRNARQSDMEWLLNLRLVTMTAYIEASGERLSDEEQMTRITQDFDCIKIVTQDDKDIGMMKVTQRPEKWRLVQIQILPQYQGRGIGVSVISSLIERSRKAGVPLTLNVLKVNPAKRLYDRLGFKVVAEKDRSYEMCIDTINLDSQGTHYTRNFLF